MPIRKPRRQTLQELAYPPVPKIGGVDLRADERTLGLTDWEFGDHSTRYPQSLLSASVDGSRWGGSSVGGSVLGLSSPNTYDGSRSSLRVPSSVGAPSSIGSPTKSNSELGTSPTRSEATHHVKRKKPPSLDPDPSTVSSNPSVVSSASNFSAISSSVSKTNTESKTEDGVVRPGDIVPPDWSAAALSVVGSAPAPTPAPVPAPPSSVSSSIKPPTSYKAPASRRTSQPPPRKPSSSHSHSHTHSQPVISVPSLPTIAASPRSTIVDAPAATLDQVVSVAPLRPVKKSSSAPSQVEQGPPPVAHAAPSKLSHTGSSLTLQAALKSDVVSPTSSPTRPTQTVTSATSPRTQQPSPPKPAGSQLLQVPPPKPYGVSSQPAPIPPAPASVSGSQVSSRSSHSPRALPVPPTQSTVSTAPPLAAQSLGASIPRGATAINTWRTGVISSGPQGWGMPPSVPPQPQPIFPPNAPTVAPVLIPMPQPYGPQHQAPPIWAQYQYPNPPVLPPARSYSYESPTGGLPLPTQIYTNPDGHTSSPDVSGTGGGGGISPVVGDPRPNPLADDGRPGLQRAPSKLRRKLTKNKGWHPAVADPAAPTLSASSSVSAPVPGSVPPQAPAPSEVSSRRTQLALPSLRQARAISSGGRALVPAQRAFIGRHRPAVERVLWGLPMKRDPRVMHAISKIEGMKDAIVTFGAEQFVETRMRGAVICNVAYRPEEHPDDLAFDWITYKDAQKTLEPTLQKVIARTDPTTAVLVLIFLLSPSLNSLAIWRKTISVTPGQLSRLLTLKTERVKRETASQEHDMALKLDRNEEKVLNLDAIPEEGIEWSPPATAHNVLLKSNPSISRDKRFFRKHRHLPG